MERRPVFLALPRRASELKQGAPEVAICLISLATTGITTLGFALSTYILADGGAMLTQLEKSAFAATALPCSDTASPGRVGLGCA